MRKVVIDTDVIIDLITSKNINSERKESSARFLEEFIESGKNIGHISPVSVAELFSGNKNEHDLIREILSIFSVIDLDTYIAEEAGNLRREHKISLPDAIIASTAKRIGAVLITWNIGDYKNILEVKTPDEMLKPF